MIKTPLLVSLAAAALLTGNAQAASMFDRMTEMETEMKALQSELKEVKAAKAVAVEAEEEAEEDVAEGEEAEDEEGDEDEEEVGSWEEVEEQLTELNKRTSGNHLKFGVDFRTSVDNLQYTMADGSKQKNDALFTNRLWLNMDWAASENMSFTGQLAYNKAYGNRSGFDGGYPGFETFDWITNENPYDDVVRVRSAYFFYRNDTFLGTEIPWTFSIGRRPSTNGHLINLRDNDPAASPMGHTINVEFDGLSSKFTLVEDIGMYVKFCAGRGGTNANAKFFTIDPNSGIASMSAPYAANDADLPDIDLGGLIFVPYNDGQYSIGTQYYYANNLIDADMTPTMAGYQFNGMTDVGGLHSFTGNVVINGIGDEWSDFLDDTTLFVSGAVSITDPKDGGQGMLGSTESVRGWSGWVGMQFPSLISEDGRWGVEWNQGTQNWRSITYAEDTLAGSKIAARGDAYEAYFTEPLIEGVFSFQLRYTYIDYKWAGSNGFFGSTTGTPTLISDLTPMTGSTVTVDKAQDIRAYLRYRF
ncbi:MAG: DUF3373 family protein [Sulfurimonadaceae bacterium]